MSDYAFGDGDVAARRLRMVGEIFDPGSRAFVQACAPPRPAIALDLGCGPGGTTALVAGATSAACVIGVEWSADFVRTARRAHPARQFVRGDVEQVPFPPSSVDLVYARLLLSHLEDPESTARGWLRLVRTGGVMLLDEVAWIRTDEPTLARYLRLAAEAMSGDLYVGRRFPGATIVEVPVANERAAEMFRLNLSVWGPSHTDLAADLARVAPGTITWGVAQAAIRPGAWRSW